MMLQTDGTRSLSGKVAAITCLAHDTVGEEIIAQLLLNDIAKVYVLTGTANDFAGILEELSIKEGLSDCASVVELVPCDLSSIQSASTAALALLRKLQELKRLDLLFCNASSPVSAPGSGPDQDLSPDGLDRSFAVGYLGHFVLLNTLLPLIEQTATEIGQARIVTATSYLYVLAKDVSLDSLTSHTASSSQSTSDILTQYSHAQLSKILLTLYVAKLENGSKGYSIFSNCFDATNIRPDLIGTVAASLPPALLRTNGQSPEKAAETAIRLASSSEIPQSQISGQYFGNFAVQTQLEDAAQDKDLMNNLWYFSDHKVTEVLGKGWEDSGKGLITGS